MRAQHIYDVACSIAHKQSAQFGEAIKQQGIENNIWLGNV